jgi:tellurite resistance protein TerC
VRTLLLPERHFDFRSRWPTRFLFKALTVSQEQPGHLLVTRIGGRLAVTPLLMAVLTAAVVDASLAIDSVPAVFSVTRDPFLAYTASTFAVLGLRSLYFALSGILDRFRYLRLSLVFVLLAVAAKTFVHRYDHTATVLTLAVVAAVVLAGVAASAARTRSWRGAEALKKSRPTPLEDLSEAIEVSRTNLRKVLILIAGTLVVIIGLIIAPLPGPGPVILVPIGLGILATEFIWARRLLDTLRAQADGLQRRVDGIVSRTSIWTVPAIVAAYWGTIIGVSLVIKGPTPATYWVVSGSVFVPIGIWALRAGWRWGRQRRDESR